MAKKAAKTIHDVPEFANEHAQLWKLRDRLEGAREEQAKLTADLSTGVITSGPQDAPDTVASALALLGDGAALVAAGGVPQARERLQELNEQIELISAAERIQTDRVESARRRVARALAFDDPELKSTIADTAQVLRSLVGLCDRMREAQSRLIERGVSPFAYPDTFFMGRDSQLTLLAQVEQYLRVADQFA
jgi:hypothetical protein